MIVNIFLCIYIKYILQTGKIESRKVYIPGNRYTPLKENWMKIYTPIVDYLHLQIRFNVKTRNVELKVSL